jgi:hypothetical protein
MLARGRDSPRLGCADLSIVRLEMEIGQNDRGWSVAIDLEAVCDTLNCQIGSFLFSFRRLYWRCRAKKTILGHGGISPFLDE